MKKQIVTWLALIIIVLAVSQPSPAVAIDKATGSIDSQTIELFDMPLCLPALYVNDPVDCLPNGASKTISALEKEGISYPIRELPAVKPDKALTLMPVLIARVNLEENLPVPLYASYDDAITQNNPTRFIDPGRMRYLSYIDRIDYNGKPYLRITSGEWVRAGPIAYTDFQGLIFHANPSNDFGWIIDQTPGYSMPSLSAAQTANMYYQEDIIQIYQVIEAEGVRWYLINPGEWVNSIKARRAYFDPSPPEGKAIDRWIYVELQEQILYVYEQGNLKFATLIATGMEPFFTRPGLFQIYKKLPLETMQGAFEADRSDFYYLEDVPWTMYFDESRALHGSYWRTYFGYPQSHGCVNLSPGDARWLFNWANEGDWVYVHDPSGLTPTDPDLYGPGAP
jgi:hypothetical protein